MRSLRVGMRGRRHPHHPGQGAIDTRFYCDGLGACLGDCPRAPLPSWNAKRTASIRPGHGHVHASHARQPLPLPVAPSSRRDSARRLSRIACQACRHRLDLILRPVRSAGISSTAELAGSTAFGAGPGSYFITRDCCWRRTVFHSRIRVPPPTSGGHILIIACPNWTKLTCNVEKLAQIFAQNSMQSITVAIMEVPCCNGLVRLANHALAASGAPVPVQVVRIGIRGKRLSETPIPADAARHDFKGSESRGLPRFGPHPRRRAGQFLLPGVIFPVIMTPW